MKEPWNFLKIVLRQYPVKVFSVNSIYFWSLLLKLLLDKSDMIASIIFLSTTPCTDIVDYSDVIPSSLQYFLIKPSTDGKKSRI